MATVQTRTVAVLVFAVAFWAATLGPAIVSHIFGIGRPITRPELEFAIEVTTLTTAAASLGYAFVRGANVPRALIAVPLALGLLYLVPSRAAVWLSETYRSVLANTVALVVTFAVVGFGAGWLVARCCVWWDARHA